MIVDPDFCDHWKTRMLVGTLDGDECAPLYVLRLWAHCQNRRQSTFENISPEALKALCRFLGNANKLEASLVTSGFVRRDGKVLEVVGWEEYNSSLIAAWSNGARGGRPPKFKPLNNPIETQSKPVGKPVGKPLGINPGVCDRMRLDKERESAIPFLETRSTQFLEAWQRWRLHSMDKGKTIHGTTEDSQLQKLTGAYPDESDAIAAIDHAIVKNWANINLGGDHKRIAEPSIYGKPSGRKVKTNQEKLADIFKSQGL